MPAVLAHVPINSQLHTSETEKNRDLQSPSRIAMGSRTTSTGSSHPPDLSTEVAALSTKLINAINHQTNLDDSLQASRHELAAARERIAQLEAVAKEHSRMVANGLLIKRSESQRVEESLKSELAEERTKRGNAEKDKKGIELELETLTSALFEEANAMVAEARRDSQAADRKNDQLQTQLKDAEALLASHQQQLHELKAVLQQIQAENETKVLNEHSTAPTTPETEKSSSFERTRNGPHLSNVHPENPLHYSHLISPRVRTDLQAYEEFTILLQTSKQASPDSRAQSGNFTGFNVMGVNSVMEGSQTSIAGVQSAHNSGNSRLSLPTSSSSPNLPGSFAAGSPKDPNTSIEKSSLKETKFYKRVLAEDIEPTLRLDTAPGLSWLARRTILNSMISGSLFVDPLPAHPSTSSTSRDPNLAIFTSKLQSSPAFPCALCGEQRSTPLYARRHRFRTSENDETAQRYPLCDYCVGRLRATCDFVRFLRMAKNGNWSRMSGGREANSDTKEEEERRSAWDESVRLRERMFWSRIGGGVVPVGTEAHDSLFSHRKVRRDMENRPSMSLGEAEDAAAAMATHQEQIDEHRLSHIKNTAERPALESSTDTQSMGPDDASEDFSDALPSLQHHRSEDVSEVVAVASGHPTEIPPTPPPRSPTPPPTSRGRDNIASPPPPPTEGVPVSNFAAAVPPSSGSENRPSRSPRRLRSSLLSRFQRAAATEPQPRRSGDSDR